MPKLLFDNFPKVENQFLWKDEKTNIEVWLKREDKIHPDVSGNKYRKLKYNIKEANAQNQKALLTFGGAYSNHIAAVAAAGKLEGFSTIGIIRGDELGTNIAKTLQQNETLNFAHQQGMKFHFISRSEYREKDTASFQQNLHKLFGEFYLIPEGGTNAKAVRGCEEILSSVDKDFDVVCCPVGTGGTISGIINASAENQQIIGFSALKGDFLKKNVAQLVRKNNWEMNADYHFGGYAKVTLPLIEFLNGFKRDYQVQLDPIYTGKMMYGITDLIAKGKFSKNTRILAVHTGGLQAISGMNNTLKRKQLPLIEI